MIAIENNSVDCVEKLCSYDEIDVLNIKARYPKYNALEFACYHNDITMLKMVVSRAIKTTTSMTDTDSIFESEMIDQMLQIAKLGAKRSAVISGAHDECIQFISNTGTTRINTPTQTLAVTVGGFSNNSASTHNTPRGSPVTSSKVPNVWRRIFTPGRKRSTATEPIPNINNSDNVNGAQISNVKSQEQINRGKILDSQRYECGSCGAPLTAVKLVCSTCKLCQKTMQEDNLGYYCNNDKCSSKENSAICQDCAFVVSILNIKKNDDYNSLLRNHEFSSLLRNDKQIGKTVEQMFLFFVFSSFCLFTCFV